MTTTLSYEYLTTWMTNQQIQLFQSVADYHQGQTRKYTGEPYINHVVAVAKMARDNNVGHGVEIGLCHDLFEDTVCTKKDLFEICKAIYKSSSFASDICRGVFALTDVYTKESFPHLNRRERKENEAARLYKIDPTHQSIKYADLINNCESITTHDAKFAKVYLKEKKMILKYMNKGNFDLYMRACYECQKGLNELSKINK